MRNYTKRKPSQSGWYWARENDRNGRTILVLLGMDLLTVYHDGMVFSVYDFSLWSERLGSKEERMPEFR